MARMQAVRCNQPAESRQRFLLDMTIACFSVQLCVIVLKFLTRGLIQKRLWPDDWVLLASIVSVSSPGAAKLLQMTWQLTVTTLRSLRSWEAPF